jgi:hypothetical protein
MNETTAPDGAALTRLREVATVFNAERAPELADWVKSRAHAGRSSMPIYLEDVAIMLGFAEMLPAIIGQILAAPDPSPAGGGSE